MRLSCSPHLFGFLFAHLMTGSDTCSLRLSELHLTTQNDNREFIELTTECQSQTDLSTYTLVLWRPEKPSDTELKIHNIGNFSVTPNCRQINHSVLVIGSPNINSSIPQNSSDFCSFSVFGEQWKQVDRHYLDKGSKRVNALVLYQNVSGLTINQTLDKNSAHTSNVVDVIFYAKSGSGRDLYKFFLPDYDVRQRGAKYPFFILVDEDNGSISEDHRHSFSFCCNQSVVKWPMGFKWSKPSPGVAENYCNESFEYSLDPTGVAFPLFLNRCDVNNITHYNPEPITTTQKPTSTDAPHCDGLLKVTLGLGIPLALIVLFGLSVLAMVIIRKRHYQPLPDDQGCFPMNCFKPTNEADGRINLVP